MKKIATLFLFIFVLLICTSCSKDDETTAPNNTQQINLNIDKAKLPNNLSITYKAEGTGDGKVTQLKYLDDKGVMQTISSPTLPWTKTLSMVADSSVAMTATGTMSKGSLTISIDGTANGVKFHLDDSQSLN